MKNKKSLMEDKRNNEVHRPSLFGTPKAHPTGEFVAVV